MTGEATTDYCRPCAEMTAAAAQRETGRHHRVRSASRQRVGIQECSHCVVRIDRAYEAVEIGGA